MVSAAQSPPMMSPTDPLKERRSLAKGQCRSECDNLASTVSPCYWKTLTSQHIQSQANMSGDNIVPIHCRRQTKKLLKSRLPNLPTLMVLSKRHPNSPFEAQRPEARCPKQGVLFSPPVLGYSTPVHSAPIHPLHAAPLLSSTLLYSTLLYSTLLYYYLLFSSLLCSAILL